MNDYRKVQEQLSAGTDPALLCGTCPWDRYCISPPAMTTGEVEQHLSEAKVRDQKLMAEQEARGEKPVPTSTLLGILSYAGRDIAGEMCPVLTLRLRSSDGRKIADGVKAQMQDWTES